MAARLLDDPRSTLASTLEMAAAAAKIPRRQRTRALFERVVDAALAAGDPAQHRAAVVRADAAGRVTAAAADAGEHAAIARRLSEALRAAAPDRRTRAAVAHFRAAGAGAGAGTLTILAFCESPGGWEGVDIAP